MLSIRVCVLSVVLLSFVLVAFTCTPTSAASAASPKLDALKRRVTAEAAAVDNNDSNNFIPEPILGLTEEMIPDRILMEVEAAAALSATHEANSGSTKIWVRAPAKKWGSPTNHFLDAIREVQWQSFKLAYKKTYATPTEDSYRRQIFIKNLEYSYEANKQHGSTIFGPTIFFDWAPAEFNRIFRVTKSDTTQKPTMPNMANLFQPQNQISSNPALNPITPNRKLLSNSDAESDVEAEQEAEVEAEAETETDAEAEVEAEAEQEAEVESESELEANPRPCFDSKAKDGQERMGKCIPQKDCKAKSSNPKDRVRIVNNGLKLCTSVKGAICCVDDPPPPVRVVNEFFAAPTNPPQPLPKEPTFPEDDIEPLPTEGSPCAYSPPDGSKPHIGRCYVPPAGKSLDCPKNYVTYKNRCDSFYGASKGKNCCVEKRQTVGEPKSVEFKGRIDWREKGVVTPIKTQGTCGSCWAHSTVEVLESALAIAGHPLIPLSPQQLVSCDKTNRGCNGGGLTRTLEWITKNKVATEAAYPYEGADTQCKTNVVPQANAIATEFHTPYPWCQYGEKTCRQQDENALLAALAKYGPMWIAVDSENWQMYSGGIFYPSGGCSEATAELDHAVVLVGAGQNDRGEKYWIIPWGTEWGEAGYIRLAFGYNTCGAVSQPGYIKVAPKK